MLHRIEPPRAAAASGPVRVGARVQVLDALRAFALLGILISHVPDFSGYNFLTPLQQAALDPYGLDLRVHATLVLAIREKFLALFALLFGIGFAVQLDSSARRGTSFRLRFGRRLLALFLIGVVHAAIWYGDILKDYAVLGVALLLSARWPVRRIATAALFLFAFRLAWPLLVYWASSALGHLHDGAPPEQVFSDSAAGLGSGLGAFFLANLRLVGLKAQQLVYEGRFISILTMFFIGAWVGRRGLLQELSSHKHLLLRVLPVFGTIGLAAEVLLAPLQHATNAFPPTWDWVAVQTLTAVAAPALSLAYASAFVLAWWALEGRFLRVLAPVGRMALTSYVLQTLFCMAAFVWLGLGRDLGASACLLVATLVFALQCVLAKAWLSHFRFGPLEWIWRCATYGRLLELRGGAGNAVGVPGP